MEPRASQEVPVLQGTLVGEEVMWFTTRCNLHDENLTPVDGPPFCIPLEGDKVPKGAWEIDLSDMECPQGDEEGTCVEHWVVEPAS
jgi:hypothetical protein